MWTASMANWLATLWGAWAAQPKSAQDDTDFGIWWGVMIALVAAPIVMYSIKLFADRRRDRMTRELVDESKREGPVPELPADFEIPQVVPRKKERGFGRWQRRR